MVVTLTSSRTPDRGPPPGYRATVDRLSNFLEVRNFGFSSRRVKTSVKTVNDSVCLERQASYFFRQLYPLKTATTAVKIGAPTAFQVYGISFTLASLALKPMPDFICN